MNEEPLTPQQQECFDGIADRENFIEWYEGNPDTPKSEWDKHKYSVALMSVRGGREKKTKNGD